MRKFFSIGIVALLLVNLVSVTALAASSADPGIYDVTLSSGYDVTYKALDKDGNEVTGQAAELGGTSPAKFFANAVKLKVTISGLEDEFQLILAQSEYGVPTQSNIVYIDQETSADGKVEFTVYPKSLSSGSTYYVYLANASGRRELLTFKYYQSYMLGDVDENGKLSSNDALFALQAAAGKRTLSENARLAADADKNGKLSSNDALFILQAAAGKRTLQ